jgi:hypothetical protein
MNKSLAKKTVKAFENVHHNLFLRQKFCNSLGIWIGDPTVGVSGNADPTVAVSVIGETIVVVSKIGDPAVVVFGIGDPAVGEIWNL